MLSISECHIDRAANLRTTFTLDSPLSDLWVELMTAFGVEVSNDRCQITLVGGTEDDLNHVRHFLTSNCHVNIVSEVAA